MMDQNIPGFNDDNLGNDGDGDSLTKSKLNLNAAKDKKKPFFKKVNGVSLEKNRIDRRLCSGSEYHSV